MCALVTGVQTCALPISEAVALAQRSGIDAATLNTALAGGWADSTLLQIFVPRMTAPVEQPLGTLATMLKDVENVAALARATGTEMAGLNGVLASRSEEHTSELQSLMRISYAIFCLKKKNKVQTNPTSM